VRSSGDTGDRGEEDTTADSWRGDLGGVRVAGRDVWRTCGKVFGVDVVGDSGGLHCEVAFRKGGGWWSGFDVDRPWKTRGEMGPWNGLPLRSVRI
jgi:predicted chitinase